MYLHLGFLLTTLPTPPSSPTALAVSGSRFGQVTAYIALAKPHLCSFIPLAPASSLFNISSVYDEQCIEHYSSRLSAWLQDTLFYTQLFQAGNCSSSRFLFFF